MYLLVILYSPSSSVVNMSNIGKYDFLIEIVALIKEPLCCYQFFMYEMYQLP